MLPQHLHQRVLDKLAGRPGREQLPPIGLPGVPDRVTALYGLPVAAFGLGEKIGAHKNGSGGLSSVGVARAGRRSRSFSMPVGPPTPWARGASIAPEQEAQQEMQSLMVAWSCRPSSAGSRWTWV